ncbi:Invasion associated family protein [Candidatus Rhodobacter oscarellae]|uniref:Invasion associated family protein n=1 Tax=Candidatus Rhodobacter oscarellae TaxID=1675527 RepID=A0A0J9E4J1_9RHOB|nr:invasion associated locus B family protein [Candidatus Rhodobacter lobularis]KMW57710.1 Invasion associated family protein [Candidatus Rhodobacter lobularis]
MTQLIRSFFVAALLAGAAPAFAQTTDTTAAENAEEGATPNPLELSMGEPDINVGDIYLEEQFTDWEVRCIKSENGNDPCQLYQLIRDGQGENGGTPVAEINIFPIGGEGQPAAGATIITPLETLLTQQLGLSIDGGQVRKYPFSWCSQIGCFARVGFSDEDVNAFRRGVNANVIIVPVADPSQKIGLRVSLAGFTAGFKSLVDRAAAAAAAAPAE